MKFELNLKMNSYDFFINSIENYKSANNNGDHHLTNYYQKLKFKTAFIFLSQSFELLLKSILYDTHNNLIYANIDVENLKEKNTITFTNAINRINNFTEYKIDFEQKKFLLKCISTRNNYMHYQVTLDMENIKLEYEYLLLEYNKIHSFFYGDYYKLDYMKDIKLEKKLNLDVNTILNHRDSYIYYRERDFKKDQLSEYLAVKEKNLKFNFYKNKDNQIEGRIAHGKENQFFALKNLNENISSLYERDFCHDCLASLGEYHLTEYLCDLEVCPFCGEQLLSCGCVVEKIK